MPRADVPHENTSHDQELRVLDAVVIGSGFGGLCAAIKLDQAGLGSFLILERAATLGGTWRDNVYPGCACDVQSHLYSYSFEQNPSWTRMYAPQPEIRAYLERCADKYALRSRVRFGQNVSRCDYEEASGTWRVTTESGERYRARALISAIGAFSTPSVPKIAGLESFQGKLFHSARWDHDYELGGKNVAVIGTGASAIQFVPAIAPKVAKLTLFQRSAPWIMPKGDRPLSGFERGMFRVLPLLTWLYRLVIYWMLEARVLGMRNPRALKVAEAIAARYMRSQIKDRELRMKLRPDYRLGCKRVLLSNDYYPALARPNVNVVTDAIKEIRAHSVVTADGTEHTCDAILLGTGFEVQQVLPRNMVFGRGGVDIMDAWRDGVEAYKGISVTGFPNLFLVLGPNTGLGHSSMVFMIESQVAYIVKALRSMKTCGYQSIDVKQEAQRRYNDVLQAQQVGKIWLSGCKSWYLDANGRNTTVWPGFTFSYRQVTRRVNWSAYEIQPLPRSQKPSAVLRPAQSV